MFLLRIIQFGHSVKSQISQTLEFSILHSNPTSFLFPSIKHSNPPTPRFLELPEFEKVLLPISVVSLGGWRNWESTHGISFIDVSVCFSNIGHNCLPFQMCLHIPVKCSACTVKSLGVTTTKERICLFIRTKKLNKVR